MLDETQLQKLLTLSDQELRQRVLYAAAAAGADVRRTAAALGDMGRLRGMISSLKEEDIRKMTAKIDPNTLQTIVNRLKQTEQTE